MQKYKFLSFSITVLKISNLWSIKDDYIYDNWRLTKDSSLILSMMPCILSILADFFIHINGTVLDVAALTENFIALICIAGMIYITICFIQNRKLVNSLIQNLSKFTQFHTLSSLIQTDKKANLYAKMILFYGIFGNIVYMTIPIYSIENCRNRQKLGLTDKNIPCGLVTRCWFPFKFDYTPIFQLIFLHQFYTCTMVSVIILILTMLLCGFLMHITNQLVHLRHFIKNINYAGSKIDENIRFCVDYHSAVISYWNEFNEAFSGIAMLYLTLTSLVISALGFEILVVDNFHYSLRFTLHLIGWLVLLLLVCYYGQSLINESVVIAEEMYCKPWYKVSVKTRKDIYLILIRAQKPLTLNAGNIGVISFPTFLKISSSAYSYFTLFLNIIK